MLRGGGIVAYHPTRLQRPVTGPPMLAPFVDTGLDVLVRDGFAPLRGLRVGLVANPASAALARAVPPPPGALPAGPAPTPAAVDARLRHAAELIAAADRVRLG